MKTVSLRAKIGVATLNIALLSSTIMTTPGMAQDVLPTGGKVVAGSATISTDRGSMTIDQSTDKLVTNWDSFSIGESNSVTFNQPTAQSIALNRVIGQDPSRILGRLTANGNVFLLNPNGIVISKDGSVQSGGFVGSTLGMSDKDFLDGKHQFTGSGEAIVNQGNLKGGVVALIAPRIQNTGTITGDTALAAGTDVTLDFDGDGLISVEVSASTLSTLVENSGLIKADGGLAILTAKGANDAMRGVVNNSGAIEAAALQNRDGRILLLGDMEHGEVNADGTLSASFVETSAARVNIADGLQVKTNGGNWLIDPNDFVIAASGGNMTGAAITNNLANGNVEITTLGRGGESDILVNDSITWSSHTLTLDADRNIYINAPLYGSGTAGLTLEYAQRNTVGDFYINAPVNLASTGNFTTWKNTPSGNLVTRYTIITNLGAAGSTTGTDLQGINGNLSGNYVLGSDIDASSTANWNNGAGFKPIGYSEPDSNGGGVTFRFSGNFDGLGHQVSGLFIDRPSESQVGLFGAAGNPSSPSSIRNLRVRDARVTGSFMVGGLLGTDFGDLNMYNVHVLDSTVSGITTASLPFSGLAIGGLAGRMVGRSSVSHSSSFASVSGNRDVGGLVGDSSANISNSSSSGSVVATTDNAGGLVGFMGGLSGGSPRISNSYSFSSVSGRNNIGGLVGQHQGSISNSYAAGRVTGTFNVGGLVGVNSNAFEGGGQISQSFWDTEATGRSNACGSNSGTCGAVGLTTAQMKDPANFTAAGWDFGTIWAIDPTINNGYPYLRTAVGAPVVTPPPPPPPPPAPVLAINDFGTSFSTTAAPYQPTIALTGSNFDAVTEIRFSYTGPNGQAGTIIWNVANQFGGGRFVVGAGGTSATISPVLVAAGDPSGSYQWTVTFVAGSQSIAREFTVAYTAVVVPPPPPPPPAPVALTLTGGIGPSYSTPVAPYGPVLNLTGSGFQGVTEIRLSYAGPANQSGTIVLNQDNQFKGRWTNVTNGSATFAPVLLVAGDTPGPYRWTVTFVSGGTPVTRSFVVNYTGAQLEPPVTSALPQNPSGSLLLGGADTTPIYVTTAPYLGGETTALLAAIAASDINPALKALITETIQDFGSIKDFGLIADNVPYAMLSNAVYGSSGNDLASSGWQTLDGEFPGLLSNIFGFSASVYRNSATGETVIAFAGTNQWQDWVSTNFTLGAGQEGAALRLFNAVTASCKCNVTLTGHSLGGGLAQVIASLTGSKAITFDPAPFVSTGTKLITSDANIISFRNNSDPLTALFGWASSGTMTTVKNTADYPEFLPKLNHSMENLLMAMQAVALYTKTLKSNSLIK